MIYRREIDGLRALAVIPVILFHAGFEMFSGGFVGVDVFFVISGYLITKIIMTELAQGKFSIINFYERRARRILPALFFVMLICIPFAWFWLDASEMKNFFQSLVAVSVFASNILFWLKEGGYFDTAAELKPLLHTWSLAVEEQFYVIFPIFFMLLWKLGKRLILVALGIFFVSSLALSQWAVYAKPSAAFYLLSTRGWELLIGAFTAFYLSQSNRKEFAKVLSEVGGWLGVVLIIFAVFAYSKETRFPGFYALVPTLGTVLIILFATHQTVVGKFVGNKAFVGVGLISYSAYLWHQPLFVFGRSSGFINSHGSMFSLLFLSLVLAFFSWKFVEEPFRSKSKFGRFQIFVLAFLGSIFFTGIGLYGHIKKGFPIEALIERPKILVNDFIIIGDSHAGHLVSGIASITTGSVQTYVSTGCIPFRNVDRYDSRFVPGECAKRINSWLDKVIHDDPKAIIILSSMGPIYLDGIPFKGKGFARVTGLGVELITDKSIKDKYKVFEIGLRQTLAELSSLKRAVIVFSLDIPELGIDYGCSPSRKQLLLGKLVVEDFITAADPNNCFVKRSDYDARVASYKKLVLEVLSDFPNVLLFDPTNTFCNEELCKGFDSSFGFLYRDIDHLSDSGSRFYAEAIVKSILQPKD
tara:strand:+ start:274 stop:2196 length:1923 start_codon:yes stop_codon:yes gene_type:complete